jgi:hypothetical protein
VRRAWRLPAPPHTPEGAELAAVGAHVCVVDVPVEDEVLEVVNGGNSAPLTRIPTTFSYVRGKYKTISPFVGY